MDASVAREPRRRTVRLADGEMSMLDFGDPKRPVDVVWAHANGFNAQTYRGILQPLSAGLRILAVDLRGHGESTLPADPARHRNWRVYVRDLGVLLQGLEGRPPVLAGHSMGGASALLAAAAYPGRARAVVLFDPVILPRAAFLYGRLPWSRWSARRQSPLVGQALARRALFPSIGAAFKAYKGRGAFKSWPDATLADYVAGGFAERDDGQVELRCAPAWESANFATAMGANPWRAFARVKVPVRVLKAEHGSTCRLAPGDSLLRRRPNLAVEVVEGASHFLPMERPERVREALLDAAAL